MAKKKRGPKITTGSKEKMNLLSGGLENMTYRDCKRRAISLGMPFPDACAADWNKSFLGLLINLIILLLTNMMIGLIRF